MARQSKRTSAPMPHVVPLTGAPTVPAPAIPPVFGPGAWCPPYPPQPMASESSAASCWLPVLQQDMTASPARGPWWAPSTVGASTGEDPDVQAWGVDATPSGGFINFLNKGTPSHGPTQDVSNGSSSHPIHVTDDTNGVDCVRTEKRLLWTKTEDTRLVGAWLNNSNDPIHSNYKKNDQYWKEVTIAYNNATLKNRARLFKQIKDRFGRIKKRVAWFCGSWKEANALWASGESDVNLMEKALKPYEEEHKKDGPFMFKHCWDILRKEPK